MCYPILCRPPNDNTHQITENERLPGQNGPITPPNCGQTLTWNCSKKVAIADFERLFWAQSANLPQSGMCANELHAQKQCVAMARWKKNKLLFNCTRGMRFGFVERPGWVWAPYLVSANIAAYLQVDLQPDASSRAWDCNPLQKATNQLRNPPSHMLLGTGWGIDLLPKSGRSKSPGR